MPGAVTFNNSNGDYTLSSSSGNGITGSTSLVKSGTSALNITNNNTYTGATTINAGTVNLSGGLNGTAITVANGASLNVTSTGVISGASSLNTSGNVLIAGTNTYTGATTIAAGASIQLGDGATNGSLGSSAVTNDGTLAINSVSAQTAANVISGSGTLTKSGAGTLTLSGNNSFTGDLTINAGTVAAGTAQGVTPTTSNLGALQPPPIETSPSTTAAPFTYGRERTGDRFEYQYTFKHHACGKCGRHLSNGLNGAGAGWWNKIGATNLNGGTIRVGSGADAVNFQGLALIGNVTVSGSTASSIENFAVTTATTNGVHLGQNATAGQSIVFNVADVTSSTASDLNISTRLLNTSSTNTASGLTKTGAGTLTLSGINTTQAEQS